MPSQIRRFQLLLKSSSQNSFFASHHLNNCTVIRAVNSNQHSCVRFATFLEFTKPTQPHIILRVMDLWSDLTVLSSTCSLPLQRITQLHGQITSPNSVWHIIPVYNRPLATSTSAYRYNVWFVSSGGHFTQYLCSSAQVFTPAGVQPTMRQYVCSPQP